METVLQLSVGGFPPFSARGCSQKLWLADLGKRLRTLNGDLVYVGPQLKKYRSRIEGQDETVLATEGLCPGAQVQVGCLQRLGQRVEAGSCEAVLERSCLRESVIMSGDVGFCFDSTDPLKIVFSKPLEAELFISYRPLLSMMVGKYELQTQEWEGVCSWVLEVEEV